MHAPGCRKCKIPREPPAPRRRAPFKPSRALGHAGPPVAASLKPWVKTFLPDGNLFPVHAVYLPSSTSSLAGEWHHQVHLLACVQVCAAHRLCLRAAGRALPPGTARRLGRFRRSGARGEAAGWRGGAAALPPRQARTWPSHRPLRAHKKESCWTAASLRESRLKYSCRTRARRCLAERRTRTAAGERGRDGAPCSEAGPEAASALVLRVP